MRFRSRFFSFLGNFFLILGGLVFSFIAYNFVAAFYYHPIIVLASEAKTYQVHLEWKSEGRTKVVDVGSINKERTRKKISGLFLSGHPEWVITSEGKEARISCEAIVDGIWRGELLGLKIEDDIVNSRCRQVFRD